MPESVRHHSGASVVSTGDPRKLERLRALTRLLDSAIPIPGTRYRFGLDAVIGVFPWVGDVIGAILSSYIVMQAARLGASKPTLIRMMGNVALDAVVGEIPFLGDLFDVGWKANTRNLQLLEAHLQQPVTTARSSRRVLWLVGAGLLLLIIGMIALGVLLAELAITVIR
jgi:Domain of unknown function (DUF4112)